MRTSRYLFTKKLILSFAGVFTLSGVIFQTTDASMRQYRVEDLGMLSGDTGSVARAINEQGNIVGWSSGTKGTRAFFYSEKIGMKELPALPNIDFTAAYDINDKNQVVGTSGKEIMDGTPAHAVRWVNNAIQDLGTLQGTFSKGYSINNAGEVVGYSYIEDETFSKIHAFLYRDNKLVDLTPNKTAAYASAINNTGQVAGYHNSNVLYRFYYTSINQAFRIDKGIIKNLGSLPEFPHSFGSVINEKGQVAGNVRSTNGDAERIFRYTNGNGLKNLGGVGEFNRAYGMNKFGDVVGQGRPSNGVLRAFLYTDIDGMIDLNKLIDSPKQWFILSATDINNKGEIVGYAFNSNDQKTHAIVLRPVEKKHMSKR